MEALHRQIATPRSQRAAGIIAFSLISLAFLIVPVAATPLAVITPFLPMFAMAVFLTESLTSYFLITQFRNSDDGYFGALAGAYAFVAITVVVQLATFPGVFSPDGLLGAGKQSAVWLWTFWHGGFPLLVTLALMLRTPQAAALSRRSRRRIEMGLMLSGPLLAIAFACLTLLGQDLLPPLIVGSSYLSLAQSTAGKCVVISNVLALAVCIRITRLRDLLSLWLAVALTASLADVGLTLAGSARYTMGWYAARCLSVMSSTCVLGVLIWEISQLYTALRKANGVLAEQSVRDGLTNVMNRRYLEEQLPREFWQAYRDRTPLSMLMLDVDHFKSFNDRFGHQAGDRCLISVAAAIRQTLRRPSDYVARYGGEEFAIVLSATNRAGAWAIAEAVLSAIKQLHVPADADGTSFVTASIGVATLDPPSAGDQPSELIRRADAALYAAKNGGRNRVVGFESEVDIAPGPRLSAVPKRPANG